MALRQYAQPADMLSLFGGFDANVTAQSMQVALGMATSYVENQTRRILSVGTYTENRKLIVNKDYEIVINVHQYPILSVSAVTWYYTDVRLSDSPQIADTTQIDFETPPTRFVYVRNTYAMRYVNGRCSITYSAGYATMPEDIITATCLVAQELLMRQINPFGAMSINTSAGPASNSLALGQRSLNLQLADQLIAPYQAWED